jgi:O-antigen ligase
MNTVRKFLPLGFLCSFIVSLFFYETAKAWISISMFGLLASVIFFQSPIITLNSFYKQKVFFIFSIAAVFLLFFILLSTNTSYAWNRIEIQAPLFGLAIAFAGIGKLKSEKYELLLALYVFLCVATSFYTILNFLFSYESVIEGYLRAKVMPTIVNHVRYSIMIAMGVYLSYYLYRRKYRFGIVTKQTFLALAVLLFIFLHVLSVRSGLVAVYGILVVELILFVMRTRKYKIAIVGFVVMIWVIFLSIRMIPTLNNKWVNTVADLNVYLDKGYPNYNSLTTRFISYEAAFSIFKQNPLLGCGIGDIKDETDLFFKTNYPMIDIPILPHNQFLFYLSATGIIGLLVFCFAFYFPLFYQKNWRNPVLLVQYVVITLSFMTEPMLETQLGVAFTVLFIFLPLTQSSDEFFENKELSAVSS